MNIEEDFLTILHEYYALVDDKEMHMKNLVDNLTKQRDLLKDQLEIVTKQRDMLHEGMNIFAQMLNNAEAPKEGPGGQPG